MQLNTSYNDITSGKYILLILSYILGVGIVLGKKEKVSTGINLSFYLSSELFDYIVQFYLYSV